MTIKSATPSGSQRERAPSGERPWFKADIDDWGIVRDLLPRPWPARLCALDLRYMEARERFCKTARDGQTVLQARWGLSATAVKKHLRAFAALTEDAAVPMGCPEGAHGVPMGCPSEPHQADILADEVPMGCPEGAHGVPMGCPDPVENAQQVALLEAPKRESETEIKKTKAKAKVKPGTVTDEEVVAILAEMHEVLLPYYSGSKPLMLSAQRKKILFALDALAEMSAETGVSARALFIGGFRYMADGKQGYWQRRLKMPSEWYSIACRAEMAKENAQNGLAAAAATYIPTAHEALDAVLEVGCAEAEARYPAAARAIRQAFDFEMGGNLARMRNPKDPDRMRAAWAAGYAKYLTPKLALVAR